MNFFKRALLNITRVKLKSLILLLIVLILGNIMLSTLLIVQSVDGTKDSILRELPPIVSLELDYEKLQEMHETQPRSPEFTVPWLTFDDLERIKHAGGMYIKTFDFSTQFYIETGSLTPFRTHEERKAFIGHPGETNYFQLQGVGIPNFLILEMENAKIVEGRSFTREEIENGRPVLIMSKDLAETNNYMVGDTVVIESLFSDWTDDGEFIIVDTVHLEFTLIGLLEYRELPKKEHQHREFYHDDYMLEERKNTLITGNRYVIDYTEKILELRRPYYEEKYGQEHSRYEYNPLAGVPVTYILNSSEEVGKFVKTAQAALNNEYYQFKTQEDNYKKVAAPLESMKGILTYAFYITLGSAIVVLALVLFGFIWSRQKEIGIYLALGEKKSRITGQMIIESVAVGLVGATLALASGMFVASFISEMLITAPQIDEWHVIGGMHNYLSNIDYDSVMQSYRIGFTPLSILLFYLAITATIIAAQLIASVYMLRLDPKKIMM